MKKLEPQVDQLWKHIKTGKIVRIRMISMHGGNSAMMVSYSAVNTTLETIFTREMNGFRVRYVYVGEVPLPNRHFNARTVYDSATHLTEMQLSDQCDLWIPHEHPIELGFDQTTNWLLAIRLRGRYVRLDEIEGARN